MADEPEIDLDTLQNNIDESQIDQDQEADENTDESQDDGEQEAFDIDKALDGDEPVVLEGRITNEEAIEKAKERGWNPEGKDKFNHSVSAIEFLERTPLFHKMDLLRNDVDDIKKQNKRLVEQNKKIAQKSIQEQERLVKDLKAAKEQLLNEEMLDKDDLDKLKNIDKQLEQTVVAPVENNDEIVERYEKAKTEFVKDNDWYQSDYKMTTAADNYGVDYATEYLKEHGVMPEPEDTFKHVMDNINRDFPNQQKPQRQTRVASRGNRNVVNHKPNKKTIKDLPEDQQSVARMVMESADLTEAEYLKTYEW